MVRETFPPVLLFPGEFEGGFDGDEELALGVGKIRKHREEFVYSVGANDVLTPKLLCIRLQKRRNKWSLHENPEHTYQHNLEILHILPLSLYELPDDVGPFDFLRCAYLFRGRILMGSGYLFKRLLRF